MSRFDLSKGTRHLIILIVTTALIVASCSRATETPAFEYQLDNWTAANAVNINTATEKQLETIPGIGPQLAKQIVEFRVQHGLYRRPEHVMLIRGISDRRFREIRNFIRVE